MTQLFGDHAIIANATGCSSIYGGNLPTTPYTINREGRGPAWSNSLFEDNAEFGLGMRLSFDHQQAYARNLVERYRELIGDSLADSLLNGNQDTQEEINAKREFVAELKSKLNGTLASGELHAGGVRTTEARDLLGVADALVKKSVWIVGGDGWASHTLKAFIEAEAHPGPSLIIAYSQCIAHGIDMGMYVIAGDTAGRRLCAPPQRARFPKEPICGFDEYSPRSYRDKYRNRESWDV
jgi:pyruvate/2-oxoacid:ferredoxin oxidoreductase beta subunit